MFFLGRPDGRKLKNLDYEYPVAAHIMAKRSDAMNMTTLDIPLEPIHHYLNQKRKEGIRYSHLTVILAAVIRTISQYPALNRFVVNKRIYARNELAIGMVVLKGGRSDEAGTADKRKFKPESTIADVDKIINDYVEKNRSEDDVNGTDRVAKRLVSTPGLLRVGVGFMKWLDKHNWMPKSVVEISPFHCTMMFTNLASIKTDYVFHHAYDFGTVSLTLAVGKPRYVPMMHKGEVVMERCMPMGLVMDERIASGAYFALAFREFRKYLENPALLETPPEQIPVDEG